LYLSKGIHIHVLKDRRELHGSSAQMRERERERERERDGERLGRIIELAKLLIGYSYTTK